jgi:5'-methylthioadenosine phosphorylase
VAGRLALIAGQSLLEGELAAARRIELESDGGRVALIDADGFVLLQRHGLDRYVPAHLVDHRANLSALERLGCDRALAICSVGGLRVELGVGTMLAPDDFIALHLGLSAFDDRRGHRVPGFDLDWRRGAIAAWDQAADAPLIDRGVYWQAIGPRFETMAEIRLIAAHADVIGMTLASECVIAGELGIAYAAVCVVDNLANGIGAAPLTVAEYEAGRLANRERLEASLRLVLPELGGRA